MEAELLLVHLQPQLLELGATSQGEGGVAGYFWFSSTSSVWYFMAALSSLLLVTRPGRSILKKYVLAL